MSNISLLKFIREGLISSLLTLVMIPGSPGARAQTHPGQITFMLPDSLSAGDPLPTYLPVTDTALTAKYLGWMQNEPAQWALELHAKAHAVAKRLHTLPDTTPTYYVALVEGGNHAALGFRLRVGAGILNYPNVPYIKLSPEDWVFSTTFLHETGHVVLSLLNGGKQMPGGEIAAIPHSTAALTDRGTAFDEGFAIHLETLAAKLINDPVVRERYHHDHYLFGASTIQSEYHRQANDLLTYSQGRARYQDVAENAFAFCSAFKGPDYLRVQLEKARDYSAVRNANQLLQSEGFYAGFFYSLLMRGSTVPTRDTIAARQDRVLQALGRMFTTYASDGDSPFLIRFVVTYARLFPDEATAAIAVLNELSHGAFVDDRAAAIWRDHYLGSLRLDLKERNNKAINEALTKWNKEALKDTAILSSRLGPQIRCTIPGDSVRIEALEASSVLSFDVNTVEEGIIRIIPGISDGEVGSWLTEREKKPYIDQNDFRQRSGIGSRTLERLKF